MTRLFCAAMAVAALLGATEALASPAGRAEAATSLSPGGAAPTRGVPTDVSAARRHYRYVGNRWRVVRPYPTYGYYGPRPHDYRPWPYYAPVPFGFGFGFDPSHW